jgi:hypothetical protein
MRPKIGATFTTRQRDGSEMSVDRQIRLSQDRQ